MKKILYLVILAGIQMVLICAPASAATVAYWRFEEGTAGQNVQSSATGPTWSADLADSSGNGHFLSAWNSSQWQFRANVPYANVPWTGAPNVLSVKNVSNSPTLWNESLASWEPEQWTIEVTFKAEANGWKTMVGRDSQGALSQGTETNQALAGLYLQTTDSPARGLAIKFIDRDGYWHAAEAGPDAYVGFNFSTDPDGNNAPWYTIAATSDGTLLSLYLYNHDQPENGYVLIAQTDMTVTNPGSTDTALDGGAGDGGDWDAGNITVGRGMYNGGHGDRFYGYLDEVRFSDRALSPDEFLLAPGYVQPVSPEQNEYLNSTAPITYTWTADIPEEVIFDNYTVYIADAPADLGPTNPVAYLDTAVIKNKAVTEFASALTYEYGEDYYWRIDMTTMDPNYAVADPNFPEYNIPVLYQGIPVRFFGPRACAALTISDDVVNVPDPISQIYIPQNAVFTTTINRGTVDVAAISWYKVAGAQDDLVNPDLNDPADIAITTGIAYDPDLANATSTTLTIASATPADNGDYYARVRLVDPIGGGSGCETNSPTANLFVRDDTNSGTNYLVHRYGFAADATDSIGAAHGVVADLGELNHAFVDGQIVLSNGNLNSRPVQAVQIPDPTPEDPNHTLTLQQLLDQPGAYVDLPNGMISALGKTATFMGWFTYNAAATGNWPRLFDFGISTGGEGFSTGGDGVQWIEGVPYLDTTAPDTQEYVMMSPKRDAGPGWRYESVSRPGSPISHTIDPAGTGASQVATAPNEVCVACVFDGANGVMRVYVNGVQVGQNTNLNHDLANLTDVNNWLGRSTWADAMFSGSINEFRIYDVALSGPWIKAYYDLGPDDYVTKPNPCIEELNTMDFNQDCVVNLDDFAAFAAQWLQCGRLDGCN